MLRSVGFAKIEDCSMVCAVTPKNLHCFTLLWILLIVASSVEFACRSFFFLYFFLVSWDLMLCLLLRKV